MAKLPAGMFGPIIGQIAGLVFGAARDRTGKPVTARILVIPANPNTAAQQVVRGQFQDAVYVARGWSPDAWSNDWDRAIGQLPGFQSIMSVLTRAQDSSFVFSAPADTPLGTLHLPDTITLAAGSSSGDLDITWSTENGYDGTATDVVKAVSCLAARDTNGVHPYAVQLSGATRADGATGITLSGYGSSVDVLVGVWLAGAGSAAGKLSPARWEVHNTAV